MASAAPAPGPVVPNGSTTMVSSGKEATGRAVLSVSTPEKAMSEELKE